jgi:hypothetical protein
MKHFKPAIKPEWQLIITAIVITILLFLLFSCSTTEQLTEPNSKDRTVTGYTKDKKKYLVVDGEGRKAIPVRIEAPDTLNLGDHLICRNEFRNVYERY